MGSSTVQFWGMSLNVCSWAGTKGVGAFLLYAAAAAACGCSWPLVCLFVSVFWWVRDVGGDYFLLKLFRSTPPTIASGWIITFESSLFNMLLVKAPKITGKN